MPEGNESVALHKCQDCGHSWYPRPVAGVIRKPYRCPNTKCGSIYWEAGRPAGLKKREAKPKKKRRRAKE